MAHRKQTPAQRAASLKNLRKARRARKGVSHAGRKHHPKTSARETARRHVARHSPRRRRRRNMARDTYPGGWTTADVERAYPSRTRRRKHRTPAQRAAAIRNLAKARSRVTRAGRRRGQLNRRPHQVRGYYGYRNGRRYHVKAHHSREDNRRRRGAMENPLGVGELMVGGLTGVIGFGVADVLDRFLATHALTDSGQKDANGFEVYTDTPPTSGNYSGLYNATAILAPMDAVRWAAGIGLAAVPLVGAHFIKSPTGRAALQFFGFGAGIRVVGKGLVDLSSMLLKKTSSGQRLYDAELRAQLAKAGPSKATGYPTLPTAGLGAAPQAYGFGCGCQRCSGAPAITPAAVSTPAPAPAVPQQPTNTVMPPTPPAAVATSPAPGMSPAAVAPATGAGKPVAYAPPRMPQRLRSVG